MFPNRRALRVATSSRYSVSSGSRSASAEPNGAPAEAPSGVVVLPADVAVDISVLPGSVVKVVQ
jgi:hypothetical protein